MSPLQADYPWASTPLIASAPMTGFAGPNLATAVTRAGALGLLALDPSCSTLTPWLNEVEDSFSSQPIPLQPQDDRDGNAKTNTTADLPYLPIGLALLVPFTKLDTVISLLKERSQQSKKPPVLFWLFAAAEPSTEIYATWATALREVYAGAGAGSAYTPQIWIQAGGSASAIVELAQSRAAPDTIVVQGSDAGGHGVERGASLFGVLPEVVDQLAGAFALGKGPRVLASGGIVDARGAFAALALGAEGVVMGTRFLASPETVVPHPGYRERVLATRDGAVNTIRAKVFDELKGPNIWPVAYDGRALVSRSWRESAEEGASIEAIRKGHAEAVGKEDGGYGADSDRAVVWVGSAVGLVNEMKGAGDVVREVREGVRGLSDEWRRRFDTGSSRL